MPFGNSFFKPSNGGKLSKSYSLLSFLSSSLPSFYASASLSAPAYSFTISIIFLTNASNSSLALLFPAAKIPPKLQMNANINTYLTIVTID